MQDCKVDILGTEWSIYFRDEKDDERLLDKCRDGYTDISTREIVICNKKEDCELADYERYQKLALRHELLHAFLMESGLDASSSMAGAWAINEEMVDWFAAQSPKIFRVYVELGLVETTNMSITYHGDGGSISVGHISADRVQAPALVAKSAMI